MDMVAYVDGLPPIGDRALLHVRRARYRPAPLFRSATGAVLGDFSRGVSMHPWIGAHRSRPGDVLPSREVPRSRRAGIGSRQSISFGISPSSTAGPCAPAFLRTFRPYGNMVRPASSIVGVGPQVLHTGAVCRAANRG